MFGNYFGMSVCVFNDRTDSLLCLANRSSKTGSDSLLCSTITIQRGGVMIFYSPIPYFSYSTSDMGRWSINLPLPTPSIFFAKRGIEDVVKYFPNRFGIEGFKIQSKSRQCKLNLSPKSMKLTNPSLPWTSPTVREA